jgi:hypothetical protein
MNPQGYPPQQGYPQQPPGYPPQQGYGPPQGPPPKKGMNGCLLAALIVGGIGIVVAAIAGIFIYKAAKAITAVAEEGLNAPGSAELRAAGCEAAVVMDLSKISALFDAGATQGSTPGIVISCATSPAKKAPTCDDLAKTYVKAVGAPGTDFIVQVQPQGGAKPDCKKVYSPKGTFLHDER